MKYTALLTRMFTMADESIQIKLEDTDSFDTFKERVYTALKVTDTRAHIQMRRLFDDTDLTNQLSYSELQKAKRATEIMYPDQLLPPKLDLGEGSAIEFAKNMASGEVLKIFLHDYETFEDINRAIKDVWSIIDTRLVKTNKRELDFLEYVSSLGYEEKLKISMIMDVLFGRAFTSDIVNRLKGEKADAELKGMRNNIVQDQLKVQVTKEDGN
jgi:hypothetical protein